MCSASLLFPFPRHRNGQLHPPFEQSGGQTLILSLKLGFPCATFPTHCWASFSQRVIRLAAISSSEDALLGPCCYWDGLLQWQPCSWAGTFPSAGRRAERGKGRCFSIAVLKAFDAAAAGCEKPGACQHRAERLDASHRQEGQGELIKMH